MVAALSREHRRALETLRAANADLENRIAERTANLRESERRLAAVLDALPIGVALVGRNGALLANAVYKAYVPTIIPALDDAGVDLWEGYDHNGRRIERGDYSAARALRGERVWPGQELLFYGDPQRGPVWTRVAALPLRDDQGEIVGANVVVTDIDKEKRARDALRASEENVRAMFDVASVGKTQVDIDTRRFICVNDAFLAISGYSWEQLYQLSPLDITHPDDRGEDQAALARMVHGETFSFHREKRYVRLDGSVVWADVASNLIRDTNGRPLHTAAVIQDITERKRAEERVRLLMHEVNHRSKKILSVVQANAVRTVAGDPKEFITRFQD
ncbi:MAG: PAS domain S-box protein [Proteobacteria bacterium]|nr:PAS domain S-box protein [Pseudomonadota bacterium]